MEHGAGCGVELATLARPPAEALALVDLQHHDRSGIVRHDVDSNEVTATAVPAPRGVHDKAAVDHRHLNRRADTGARQRAVLGRAGGRNGSVERARTVHGGRGHVGEAGPGIGLDLHRAHPCGRPSVERDLVAARHRLGRAVQQHVVRVHLAGHEGVDLAVVGEAAGSRKRLREAAAEADVRRPKRAVPRGDRVRLQTLVLPRDGVPGEHRHLVRYERPGLNRHVCRVGERRARRQGEEGGQRDERTPDHRLTR